MYHLNDIMPDLVRLGLCLIAQQLHEPCGEHGGFHRLGHGVGGQEQPLVQQAAAAQRGPALPADARAGEAHGRTLHQVPPSGDIAPGGGHPAAGVFDEGPHHQIGPHMGGLPLFHKLTVAVIHQNGGVWVVFPHNGAQLPDLLHRQGGPGGIALGALDEHRLYSGVPNRLGQARLVGGVVRQLHLTVLHTVVLEGAVSLIHSPHHPQQGVVGSAHGGHQHVSGFQRPKQGAGDGVGPVDKLEAHQGVLRAEQVRVDLIQLVPAQVIVPVTRSPGKIALRHPVLLERRQHPLAVGLGNGVDPGKLSAQLPVRLTGQRAHPVRYL